MSLVIKEMQIKSTMGYYFHKLEWFTIKMTGNITFGLRIRLGKIVITSQKLILLVELKMF